MKKTIITLIFATICQANAIEIVDLYGSWILDVDRTAEVSSNTIYQLSPYEIWDWKIDTSTLLVDDQRLTYTSYTYNRFSDGGLYSIVPNTNTSVITINFQHDSSRITTLKLVDNELHVTDSYSRTAVFKRPKISSTETLIGVFSTTTNASVYESGDYVQNGNKALSAVLTIELKEGQPSLVVVIEDAVQEMEPLTTLTIRSDEGFQTEDGAFIFKGEYGDSSYYPFIWRISHMEDGSVTWNGLASGAFSHLWSLKFVQIKLVPVPALKMTQVSTDSAELEWFPNVSDYQLEYATNLESNDWSAIENQVSTNATRSSMFIDLVDKSSFYRLRAP